MRTLLTTLAVFTAGCAAPMPTVRADYDRAADFTRYKTVAFEGDLGPEKGSFTTINEQRIRNATRLQLERRGYTFVEASPDLVVFMDGKLLKRQEVRATTTGGGGVGWGGGWGGGWGAWPGQTVVTTNEVTEGSLRIHLVDFQKRQLVWQASAQGTVSDGMREELERVIFETVSDMFDKYPFRAAGAPPAK